MSKRVLCKFFAHGACLKGEHCEFSHDWKDPSNNICTFYQKGVCSYGSRCRYEHVKVSRSQYSAPSSSADSPQCQVTGSVSVAHPSIIVTDGATPLPGGTTELSASSSPFYHSVTPTWDYNFGQHDSLEDGEVEESIEESGSINPYDHPICSFAAAGYCPRGDKCPHIHGDLCPTCGKYTLHPFRPEEREEHIIACDRKQKHLEALKHSQEIECSVCLERVLSKPTAAERKFGLLSECDHPFCISCIRNWRSSSPSSGMDMNSALRACPICRKLSYFVIPSVIWYSTKDEKQEIVDSYKAKLRSIDCKHFDFGNGTCPFGTSCFYRHTVEPSSFMWNTTLMSDMDGSEYSCNYEDMDAVNLLFEHLYRPHMPVGREEDMYSDEDLRNEEFLAEEMLLYRMPMDLGTTDMSSDEETNPLDY